MSTIVFHRFMLMPVRVEQETGFVCANDVMQWCPFWAADPLDSVKCLIEDFRQANQMREDRGTETFAITVRDGEVWCDPMGLRRLLYSEYNSGNNSESEMMNQKRCRSFLKNLANGHLASQ